jgi:hypothetical protein
MDYRQHIFGPVAKLLAWLLLLPAWSWGQSIERQVFGAGGGTGSTGTIDYSFTWGEPVSGTDQSNLPALTMGFHQPLPQSLLSPGLDGLIGWYEQGQTRLEWTAYLPAELARMEVQRQAAGGLFVALGEVAPVRGKVSYQFADRRPLGVADQLFYRIAWWDKGGQRGHTAVLSLRLSEAGPSLRVYPQPVRDRLTLEMEGVAGPLQFRLYDTLGQLVYQRAESVFAGWYGEWDLSALAEGGYVLEVRGAGFSVRRQIWRQ